MFPNFHLVLSHELFVLRSLGLKQDFPLAKRHYDLAAATHSAEADLAVNLALWAMHIHERIVKLQLWWKERRNIGTTDVRKSDNHYNKVDRVPQPVDTPGHPLPPAPSAGRKRKTKTEVIISHIFSWESLLILFLTLVLAELVERLRTGR